MKRTFLLILVAFITLSATAKPKRALTEKDMGAYLFTYFSDPTHGLFMAISYEPTSSPISAIPPTDCLWPSAPTAIRLRQ